MYWFQTNKMCYFHSCWISLEVKQNIVRNNIGILAFWGRPEIALLIAPLLSNHFIAPFKKNKAALQVCYELKLPPPHADWPDPYLCFESWFQQEWGKCEHKDQHGLNKKNTIKTILFHCCVAGNRPLPDKDYPWCDIGSVWPTEVSWGRRRGSGPTPDCRPTRGTGGPGWMSVVHTPQ